MFSVVIDTSVLVAALKSRRGASFALISSFPSSEYQPVLSVPLYLEYQDVLTRSNLVNGFSEAEIIQFLRYFSSICSHQEIFYLWRPHLKDPQDDMLLELAVAARSSLIITHNIRDFSGSEIFGVEAITPGNFLKKRSKP